MRGVLSDVNLQGHMVRIRGILTRLDLLSTLLELGLELATFADVGYAPEMKDRELWARCQVEGWILLTDNRNHVGAESLEATLEDIWATGDLPVLTLAKKDRFEHDREYGRRVASSVAEILFGAACGDYRDRPRIYVPLPDAALGRVDPSFTSR